MGRSVADHQQGNSHHVLQAAFWGFVGGASLLIGAVVGLYLSVPIRLVGLVMGFGVGVLISAVAFELTGAAYDRAGAVPVVLGLAAGALTFYVGDWVIDRMGAEDRKDPTGTAAGAGSSASTSLVLGALLDGIPESAAIGVSLLGGGSVGTAVVIAVFLSNIPESLSASAGMKRDGRSVAHVRAHAPQLLDRRGVGPDSAAALLIAAGDNPDRLTGEASYAALCGTSPVEASSGNTQRRRLNRGGDRQANAALYRIAQSRLRWHPPTQNYLRRRLAEGKTRREIIRCIKRYLARELFPLLHPQPPSTIDAAADWQS
jgi:hypothetical protein